MAINGGATATGTAVRGQPVQVTDPPAAPPSSGASLRDIAALKKAQGDPAFQAYVDPADPDNWHGISLLNALNGVPGFEGYLGLAEAAGGVATGAGVPPTGSVDAPDPGITPPDAEPTPGTSGPTQAQLDAFNNAAERLGAYGLGELFTITDGKPGGWLWDQIVKGSTGAVLFQALEQTEPFKRRYPVIANWGQANTPGNLDMRPTVDQVLEYERQVSQLMRRAGLPLSFYDEPGDMQNLMLNGLSPVEVEERLGAAWERVRNVNPAISAAFQQFYGVAGDSAMAAFFLDPTKTMADLDKKSKAAYTKGMGSTLGVDVDQVLAETIGQLPKTEAGIVQDLTTVAEMESVFAEGYTETENLTDETGLRAVALGDGKAKDSIEKRVLERQAINRSSTGGALQTQAGVTGLGTS